MGVAHKKLAAKGSTPARPFRLVPFPRLQRQLIDWLELAQGQHAMHALLEIDVTDARRAIRQARADSGAPPSLTAFIVACFARAIDEDRSMHALRAGWGRLVLFDEVDVALAVERALEEAKIPVPHVIRAANRKDPVQISREIRGSRAEAVPYASGMRLLPVWLLVPGFLRRLFWRRLLADPHRRKRLTGTAFVTALGMYGRGAGWGLPSAISYPVGLIVGSITHKPGVVHDAGGERVEVRDYLALTVTMDHDVIDGAPAARFLRRLRRLIEHGPDLGATRPGAPEAPPTGIVTA